MLRCGHIEGMEGTNGDKNLWHEIRDLSKSMDPTIRYLKWERGSLDTCSEGLSISSLAP